MIIISMDSHTELVTSLKPFLPLKWHSEFDHGEVLARRCFARVIDSFASVAADRTSVRQVGFTALPENDKHRAVAAVRQKPRINQTGEQTF
jgi:hypothetical protein